MHSERLDSEKGTALEILFHSVANISPLISVTLHKLQVGLSRSVALCLKNCISTFVIIPKECGKNEHTVRPTDSQGLSSMFL
jgi:hypothetical protein